MMHSSRSVPLALASLVVALASSACVRRIDTVDTGLSDQRLTAPDRTLEFDDIPIVARPDAVALADLNDEELYATGVAAAAADDHARAAMAFELLADEHRDSKHRPAALHQAGLALFRLQDYSGAVGRFLEAAEVYGATREGAEALFRAADSYWLIGDEESALGVLERLSRDEGIDPVRRVEADMKRAICFARLRRTTEAERLLRASLDRLRGELADELEDRYLPSQAQFHLAEIYRTYFLEVELDPSRTTQEKLLQDLEYKAQMLLSAQGHYLRCMRLGHPEWATASGFRVGELYQKLYEQLVDARLPMDLDPELADIYREELRSKVRVLVVKAIDAYEKTLATAERVGATNPFVQETREQLERLKTLLVKEDPIVGGAQAS